MIVRFKVITTAIFALFGVNAHATELTASTSNIQSVFAKANSGDTIRLLGSFGQTRLSDRSFNQTVKIGATAASFSDTMTFSNVSHITVLGGSYGSDVRLMASNKAIDVRGGDSISFINPTVTGFYTGTGLSILGTTNASVSGGTFSKLHAGVVLGNVRGGSVTNVRSLAAVGDGIDIVSSSNVVASNSSCSGSTPLVGAHPDCIQLWSAIGTAPQRNITLRDNYATGSTQGFTDFGSYGIASYNITMTNNRVDGYFPQGVACYRCEDSTFQGNVLSSMDGAVFKVNLNIVGGARNTIVGNVLGQFDRGRARQIHFYTRAELIAGGSTAPDLVGGVPEPASWSLMITGFALIGTARRRSRAFAPC